MALAGHTIRPSLFTYKNRAVLLSPEFKGIKKEDAAKSYLKLLNNLLSTMLITYLNGS
jgi:acyl-CoA-binding protein